MEIKLIFKDVEPITLNHSITRTKWGFTKSKSYRKLESEVAYNVVKEPNCSQILGLNDYFVSGNHYLKCEYEFYYNIKTKKNTIGKRSKDVSNIVKPIEDCIFNYLDADDAEVLELSVKKIQSEEIKTTVKITILPLQGKI